MINTAGLINDALHDREEHVRKRKLKRARLAENGDACILGEGDDGEAELEALRAKVDAMTQRMEKSVRQIIDGRVYVEDLEGNLNYLKQNAMQLTQQQSQMQQTQQMQRSHAQRQRQRRRDSADDDEDDEDEEAYSPSPTPLDDPNIEITGPSILLSTRLAASKTKYQALPHSTRYAQNNTYIGFRRMVHDAQHPGDDAPPLPNATSWFTSSGSPAPGITSREQLTGPAGGRKGEGGAGGGEEDSDDDIAIAREKLSTKCPLTLQEFRDPVTSAKCPHSFEREAILEMVRASVVRVGQQGGRAGERGVQCPVTGCDEMLTASDLRPDALLIRRIRRIQQSRNQASSDEDDEQINPASMGSTMRRAEQLISSPSSVGRGSASASTGRGSGGAATEQMPPQSSVVVDLGGSSDEEMED